MSQSHYIRIYYGPVDSSFYLTAEHKPQFLAGLRLKLQKLGYRVDLVPVDYMNHCIIECFGYAVFKCNLKSLRFNTPAERDPVCMNAVDAVVEASTKLARASTYIWLWMLLEKQIFTRTEWAPRDQWITDVMEPLPDFEDFEKCADCCGILRTKQEDASDESSEEDPRKFFPDFRFIYADSFHRRQLEESAEKEVEDSFKFQAHDIVYGQEVSD